MADTTPTLREAATKALEALESLQGGCTDSGDGTTEAITVWCPEVITTLRAALAEQAAEQAEPSEHRPDPEWYARMIRETAGDDFVVGPAFKLPEQAEPAVGFRLLPSRLTNEMRAAMADAARAYMARTGGNSPDAMYDAAVAAAPPAPARQPAPALTVGMLMEAGLMVGSTPDSVGTSNWAVRMLGALRALAVDQPDAPPAPARQEPLFLLHTGQIDSGGEQDEWDIEANSWVSVEEFCHAHPGQTIGLNPQPLPAAPLTAAPAEGGAAAKPAPTSAVEDELSSACIECGGSGMRDIGGFYPWGEAALEPCDCEQAAPAEGGA